MASTNEELDIRDVELQESIDTITLKVNQISEGMSYMLTAQELTSLVNNTDQRFNSFNELFDTLHNNDERMSSALTAINIEMKRRRTAFDIIESQVALANTQAEKDAMVGTTVTPPDTNNRFVTDLDERMTNARQALAHASTHSVGGADEIDHDNLLNSGSVTHADIDLMFANPATWILTHATNPLTLSLLGGTTLTSFESHAARHYSGGADEIDFDQLADGSVYRKASIDELSRIPNADQLAALSSGTALDPFVLASEITNFADATHTHTVSDITDFSHDHDLSYANIVHTHTASTIFGSQSAWDSAVLAIDVGGRQLDAAHAHLDVAHDWDLIAAATSELSGITAQQIANILADDYRDSRYYTKTQLIGGQLDTRYIQKTDTLTPEWSNIVNLPAEFASVDWKPAAATTSVLPNDANDSVRMVRNDIDGLGSGNYNMYFKTLAGWKPMLFHEWIDYTKIPGLSSHLSNFRNETFIQGMVATELQSLSAINLTDIFSAGSGSIITSAERTKLSQAHDHAYKTNNPHSTTYAQVGAIQDGPSTVLASHLKLGGATGLTTDLIPVGGDKQYVSSAQLLSISMADAHLSSQHLSSLQYSGLTGGAYTTLHRHQVPANDIVGLISTSAIDNLSGYVMAIPDVQVLVNKSHDEIHTIASHSDTATTGYQLDQIRDGHMNVGSISIQDAHNRPFYSGGVVGDRGVGLQIARGDHKHDSRYYTMTQLQTPGSASVHWQNINYAGAPAGGGAPIGGTTTRNFGSYLSIPSVIPEFIGEIITVSDDGDGEGATYRANTLTQGDFTKVGDAGDVLPTHFHAQYLEISQLSTQLVNSSVTNLSDVFDAGSGSIITAAERAEIISLGSSLSSHIGDDTHITAAEAATLLNRSTGVQNFNGHFHETDRDLANATGVLSDLSARLDLNSLNTVVLALSAITTMQLEIDGKLDGNQSLEDHIDSPNIPGSMQAGLEIVLGGSGVNADSMHRHSQYSVIGHTHTESEITDLVHYTDTDVQNLFSTSTITTDEVNEGSVNLYYTESRVNDNDMVKANKAHWDGTVGNIHLTAAQREALTSPVTLNRTQFHNHDTYYAYKLADAITDLSPGSSNALIVTKVNDILAKLRSAGLIAAS